MTCQTRRRADIDDIARVVDYLLGEGGRSITGSVLTVDAGSTAPADRFCVRFAPARHHRA